MSDLRRALQQECQQQTVVYLAESKKLCMAITEAYSLRGEYERRGLEMPDLLSQELQHQLLAFALMRLLPQAAVQAALERAATRQEQALGLTPPMSRAALLVGELEASAQVSSELEQAVAAALAEQPLFRVMGAATETVDLLARHYHEVAHKATQLVLGSQDAMQAAMHLQRPRL